MATPFRGDFIESHLGRSLENFYCPMDVIYTILTHSCVKSLLRFRCVCKSWRNLIDSSEFIKSHLNQSIEDNVNRFLVYTHPSDDLFYQVHDLDTFSNTTVKKLSLPGIYIPSIIGTCNGLICVSSYCCNLALFNPSTRNIRHVRVIPGEALEWECFGFGYDRRGDDYKIVGLSNEKVVVYSLTHDSWRSTLRWKDTVGEDLEQLVVNEHGVLASNCLHWIRVDKYGHIVIIVFDLHTEKWSKLPLPNEMGHSFSRLGSFDGCLYLYMRRRDWTNHRSEYEVWIMKEYGVKESWSKLFRFDGKRGMPLTYSEWEREVIFSRNRLRWKRGISFCRGKLLQHGGMDNLKLVHEVHHEFVESILCIETLTPLK